MVYIIQGNPICFAKKSKNFTVQQDTGGSNIVLTSHNLTSPMTEPVKAQPYPGSRPGGGRIYGSVVLVKLQTSDNCDEKLQCCG